MSSPKPKNAVLWSRVKSAAKKKYKVYPSAYANAWAAKEYKRLGGGWTGKDNRVANKKTAKKRFGVSKRA